MMVWVPVMIKVLLTMALVSGLSVIAERASPRLAGLLSGFPVGSALTLTFIGIEQGPAFAAAAALHNIAGMPAMLFMLLTYALISRRGTPFCLAAAPVASTLMFLLGAAGLHRLDLPAAAAVGISTAAVVAAQALFRFLPQEPIAAHGRLGWGAYLARAGVAAAVVLAVTGAAGGLGPAWAGLFTSFPVTVFPLLIILQYTYGPAPGLAVIRNIPRGLWSLLAYTLGLALLEPGLGVAWGSILALGAATAVMLVTIRAERPATLSKS